MKCLIAGLPQTGKTTYIVAFYSIEKNGNTGHKLVFNELPNDTSFLDRQKDNWQQFQIVERTSTEIRNLKFGLKSAESGETVDLCLPDIKGEIFQNVIHGNMPEEIEALLRDAETLMFFVKNEKEMALEDQNEDDEELKGQGKEQHLVTTPINLDIENISEWIKNIVVLKYIAEKVGRHLPLAVCISAWDTIEHENVSAEEWMKREHPLFYNHVTELYKNCKFYGVSAQGMDYDTNENFDEMEQRMEQKERAFVYDVKKSYDITEPIYFLLSALE